ncbi:hypothetical protein LOD99_7454 [Oopsacas minuta]|uniref:Uncharacterized protein n=1 Tax=Oopsacas minuta TaxID=111878 RepID=A0AAV7JUQ5_9METZ|nr:hypothetical protein LOD99_7454 [Oopsacas minuta]
MNLSCSHCGDKFWEKEKLFSCTKKCFKFSLCCGQGKSREREFRQYIRAYNSVLAFASIGVNLDIELANAKREVYTFRIQGVVHHYFGKLTQREGGAPSFVQIYIHDGTADDELENRQPPLGEAYLPELRELQDMLHEISPYFSYLKQGIDMMKENGVSDVG